MAPRVCVICYDKVSEPSYCQVLWHACHHENSVRAMLIVKQLTFDSALYNSWNFQVNPWDRGRRGWILEFPGGFVSMNVYVHVHVHSLHKLTTLCIIHVCSDVRTTLRFTTCDSCSFFCTTQLLGCNTPGCPAQCASSCWWQTLLDWSLWANRTSTYV